MYSSKNNALNQAFNEEKVLLIYTDVDIKDRLIDLGIPASDILPAEHDLGFFVPIEFEPKVSLNFPELLCESRELTSGFDQLKILHEIKLAKEILERTKRALPLEIAVYEGTLNRLSMLQNMVVEEIELKPRSFDDLHAKMQAKIEKNYDRHLIGLSTKCIPELNEKMLGLRDLIILTAGPGAGKTALSTQLVLDALMSDPSVCAVFVSIEMEPEVIYERMSRLLANLTYKQFHFRSKENTEDARAKAKNIMDDIQKRMHILGSVECENITPELLIKLTNKLKKDSKCQRSFIVIDSLQLWPTHVATKKKMTEIETDKWVMSEIKKIQRAFPDDPLLVIAESRKPSKSGDAWAGDMADISGSARNSFAPDAVLLLNPLNDKSIANTAKKLGIKLESPTKEDEYVAEMRRVLAVRGSVLCYLKCSKVRDGGEQFTVLLEFNYHKNRFVVATCKESSDVFTIVRDRIFSKL